VIPTWERAVYSMTADHIKKLFNQVLFEKIPVYRDKESQAHLVEPFSTLLGGSRPTEQ